MMMMTLVRITILLATCLLVYVVLNLVRLIKKVWLNPIRVQYLMSSQGIKGPPPRFLHGNTKEIMDMRRETMGQAMDEISHDIYPRVLPHVHSWAKQYGANFLSWYGPQAQLVVTEAELVKEILNNRNGNYPKIDLEGYAKKLLGDGVASSKGQKWAKMRKLANNVFHSESLRSMVPTMISSVETMLEKWKKHENKEIEVFEEFRMLASEIISKTAFGSSYLEGQNIFDTLMKLTLLVSRNAHKIKFPVISRFLTDRDELESEKLEKVIRDSIIQIITKRENEEISRTDFLAKLLEANQGKDQNSRISVEDIVDECKTFYFAGHETTTSLLSWTVLLLAINQEWQERARKEVTESFGQTNPTADSIARLKTMNMIIEESLRLYPPVPAIKRKVEKQVKLGNITLPPQTELYISPLALHHDPKIWGDDVHLFRPERFAEGIVKATSNNPVAFLPFGFGLWTKNLSWTKFCNCGSKNSTFDDYAALPIDSVTYIHSLSTSAFYDSSTAWSSSDPPEDLMRLNSFKFNNYALQFTMFLVFMF